MALGGRPEEAVVAIIRKGNKFLTIKRSDSVRAPGKICFPGGGIEFGESETEALKREISEELGVEVKPIRKVWESTTPWGVVVYWYTADLLQRNFEICEEEVRWVRWMDARELIESSELLISNAQFFEALKTGEIELD